MKIILSFLLAFFTLYAIDNKNNVVSKGYNAYEDIETPSPSDVFQDILKELKTQTAIQKEILEILKTTTGLPKKVVINGKECIENSSADCFVMPITGDALKIPVMRKWIENPSVENALEYYKWQSKYLNHTFNAGYSLNFASMKIPNPFIGASPVMQGGNNDSSYQQKEQLDKIIQKNARNLTLQILLGKDTFDIDYTVRIFDIYKDIKSLGVDVKFVFKDQKSFNLFREFHYKAPNKEYKKNFDSISQKDIIIDSEFFDKMKVHLTPIYLLSYINENNDKNINEVIGAGREKLDTIRKKIQNFLILFNISKPSEFNDQQSSDIPIDKNIRELEEENIIEKNSEEGKRAKDFKELLEKMKKENNSAKKDF
ncbi:hypothetical protein CQA57_05740 [Helicobacter anseris]|uniref:Uncharacterized protein n=1 Tax=Helicobacter anseris TaxID=375926 RepID=A0A3D8J694_9HELI|nr:hypothetical protein [Helicobacter anseris]RDU73027.1 hypothetical protein CQA57_05740 [Helicobacter anseris]